MVIGLSGVVSNHTSENKIGPPRSKYVLLAQHDYFPIQPIIFIIWSWLASFLELPLLCLLGTLTLLESKYILLLFYKWHYIILTLLTRNFTPWESFATKIIFSSPWPCTCNIQVLSPLSDFNIGPKNAKDQCLSVISSLRVAWTRAKRPQYIVDIFREKYCFDRWWMFYGVCRQLLKRIQHPQSSYHLKNFCNAEKIRQKPLTPQRWRSLMLARVRWSELKTT